MDPSRRVKYVINVVFTTAWLLIPILFAIAITCSQKYLNSCGSQSMVYQMVYLA